MIFALAPDITEHILSFNSIYEAFQLASVNQDAWRVVANLKREWAMRLLVKVCLAYVPGYRARRANPEVAFLRLVHRVIRKISAQTRSYDYINLVLPQRKGDLITSTGGGIQFSTEMVFTHYGQHHDGDRIDLDSIEAISKFLSTNPLAVDRLKHIEKYPFGQIYQSGSMRCTPIDESTVTVVYVK